MPNNLTGTGSDDGSAELQMWPQVTHRTGDRAGGSLEEDTIKGCSQQQERMLVTFPWAWSRERTRNRDKRGETQS